MTPERWKQVESLFEKALEIAPEERKTFLQNSCNGDDELRREVETLLESHSRADKFMDQRSDFFPDESLEKALSARAEGEMIGPYRIVREIGRGGMGAVYLAERADQQYQKQVAIKLIKRGMDTDAVLRHFRNERQILASFDHPTIARLFDAGTTQDGLPYFVMEYVEGTRIDSFCKEHALLIRQRLELFREACAAVSYAHRHAVIHRDIKPSNILVTNEGRAKLLDFGIAKILQPSNGAELLMTATGARPMTPEYASPEQIAGKPLTTASDVYSLGVVLFELLTGELPYQVSSSSPFEIARAIADTTPKKPSTAVIGRDRNSKLQILNPRLLRGDLDNIVLKALRKEPERRYASVEHLSEDIRRHLEARPVIARRDTLAYRAIKFAQRNRALTATAALVIVSLIGGLFATTWEAHRARAEELRAERRFNDVRHLARSVLFDHYDAIKDLPGATRARGRLVKDALNYLDSLAAEAAGDPALQRELAAAYERVGDVRGEIYSANLGDTSGALDSYQKALRIREALVAADSHDANNQRDLAGSYTKIGSQLQDTANAMRGLEYLRQACALYRRLASEHPEDAEILDWFARAENELGVALQRWGDAAGALENHNEALRIRKDLLAHQPQSELHRRHLAITYWDIAQSQLFRGEVNAALEANRNATELSNTLLAQNPTDTRNRRRLAISYQTDGDCRALAGNIAAAVESFQKKLELDEQYLANDPVNAQALDDVGYSHARIAELLTTQGDYASALDHARKALEFSEKLANASPQDLHARYQAIAVASHTAELEAKLGKDDQTGERFTRLAALLNALPTDSANPIQTSLLGQTYLRLGSAHAELAYSKKLTRPQQLEHWRAAQDFYQRSLRIWNDLRDRKLLAAQDVTKIDETTRAIAKLDNALADQ